MKGSCLKPHIHHVLFPARNNFYFLSPYLSRNKISDEIAWSKQISIHCDPRSLQWCSFIHSFLFDFFRSFVLHFFYPCFCPCFLSFVIPPFVMCFRSFCLPPFSFVFNLLFKSLRLSSAFPSLLSYLLSFHQIFYLFYLSFIQFRLLSLPEFCLSFIHSSSFCAIPPFIPSSTYS